jgi:hypothetical protein
MKKREKVGRDSFNPIHLQMQHIPSLEQKNSKMLIQPLQIFCLLENKYHSSPNFLKDRRWQQEYQKKRTSLRKCGFWPRLFGTLKRRRCAAIVTIRITTLRYEVVDADPGDDSDPEPVRK